MINAVAWTLVHFVWQGTLVSLLVSVQLRFLRQAPARYVAACFGMLLMLTLPLATFMLLVDIIPPVMQTGELGPSPASLVRAANYAAASRKDWMPLLVTLWAGGVAFFSLRNAGGLALVYLWRRRARTVVPFECHEAARRLAARLGLRRTIRLRGSSGGITPAVVGWIKPVIVIPAAALGLPFEQLEALLAHELAHIRRHDFLVNLLQSAAETLLFYHPAVWWLGRRIREERENCCDDLAVAVCGDRVTYVQALRSLAELRDRVPDLALAASGGSLVRRIARLLGKSRPASYGSYVWLVPVIAVCGVAALAGAVLMAEEGGTAPQTVVTNPFVSTAAASTGQQQVNPVPAKPQKLLAQAQAQSQQPPVAPAGAATASTASAGSYISQLADAGYTDLSADDLISLKIHGVTADYARALQSAGFQPSASELVSMRIHSVTPEYAQALRASGFANLTIDQLVAGRIHGVNADVVEQLKGAGFGTPTFDDVVSARIHGVTPEFVRGLRDAGFSPVTFDQAIAARIHGVDTNTARELAGGGLGSLNLDEVITARIHGITPDFVRRAQQLGLKNLTFDTIVALKIHKILD